MLERRFLFIIVIHKCCADYENHCQRSKTKDFFFFFCRETIILASEIIMDETCNLYFLIRFLNGKEEEG